MGQVGALLHGVDAVVVVDALRRRQVGLSSLVVGEVAVRRATDAQRLGRVGVEGGGEGGGRGLTLTLTLSLTLTLTLAESGLASSARSQSRLAALGLRSLRYISARLAYRSADGISLSAAVKLSMAWVGRGLVRAGAAGQPRDG